ncbi:MAG: hypothetical protein M1837_006274 [Sclerophora amabilis]|nr:MAG: hypothetical protein M1837_006274 [Sclerophora amabilis]
MLAKYMQIHRTRVVYLGSCSAVRRFSCRAYPFIPARDDLNAKLDSVPRKPPSSFPRPQRRHGSTTANRVSGIPRVHAGIPPTEAIDQVKREGVLIVENLVSKDSLLQSLQDVSPMFEERRNGNDEGEFFPPSTSRATGLLRHSPTYVRDQLMNPLLRAISSYFLSTKSVLWSEDGKPQEFITEPQASACIAFRIKPGARAQVLHKDDVVYHNENAEIDEWTEPRDLRRETGLTMFVAGSRTTRANGATRIIPRSHLWGNERMPDEGAAVPAEMQPGDALFMLSSCYHGGSANTTSDETRTVFASSMIRGTLRQEENQHLTISLDEISAYPAEVQRLTGFRTDFPGLGWVNLKDPMEAHQERKRSPPPPP